MSYTKKAELAYKRGFDDGMAEGARRLKEALGVLGMYPTKETFEAFIKKLPGCDNDGEEDGGE